MLGYLKRGQTYRRRGEFGAAIRDLRRASEIDPAATRPLEELGDAYLADTPHRYAARGGALRGLRQAGQPRAAGALQAGVCALPRRPRRRRRSTRSSGRSRSTSSSPRPITSSGSASATPSIPTRPARRCERSIELQPTLLQAREELADLYGALGDGPSAARATRGARGPRPGRVARGHARPRLRARRPDRSRRRDARRAPRSGIPNTLRLRRARARLARDRAGRATIASRSSKALEALEGAVGSDDSSEALTLFGRALLLTSDEETAERMLQDATQKRPVEPLAFYYLADAAERRGHYDVARRALLDYEVLRGDEADAAAAARTPRASADSRCALNDAAAAATYFLRAADGDRRRRCWPAPRTPSCAPATRRPPAPRRPRHWKRTRRTRWHDDRAARSQAAGPNRRDRSLNGDSALDVPLSDPALRIDPIPQAVAQEIEPEDQRRDRDAGEERQVRRVEQMRRARRRASSPSSASAAGRRGRES